MRCAFDLDAVELTLKTSFLIPFNQTGILACPSSTTSSTILRQQQPTQSLRTFTSTSINLNASNNGGNSSSPHHPHPHNHLQQARIRRRRKVLYPFPDHPLASPPSAEEAVNNILYNTPPTSPTPVGRHVLNCLVSNEPGVLSRVSGILAGRGFNIDSLVVSRTEVPDLSRMTIVLKGQASTIEQARRQLEDLVPVWAVLDYTHAKIIERELLLVKVSSVPHEHVTEAGDEDVEVEGFEPEGDVEKRTIGGLSPLLAASSHRQAVTELAKLFKADVVDVSIDSVVIELCAKPDKVDALLKMLKPYGIIEATRSGMMAMPRSPVDGIMFEEEGNNGDGESENDGKVDVSQLPPG
ncbi:hypothetical protein HDU97_004610 [Phlyctochytrium planicorne]|nr:hypothetical protein HDU97_004610 [Phlyctochytrium planicorne]